MAGRTEDFNYLSCAIIGATGVAGQQFVAELGSHPWFGITGLYASERSAGKQYSDSCTWHLETGMPQSVARMVVRDSTSIGNDLGDYDIIFSAVPSEIAREVEGACAAHKPVISTASAYRYEKDVPVIIPEVNADHMPLIERQQRERGWKGFVLPGPNCTTVGLAVGLKPVYDEFGIQNVVMSSYQAVSGAGYPGVASLDITDNVIPNINKEKEKVIKETVKILGKLDGAGISNAAFGVRAICARVNVVDGHTEAVFVETEKEATVERYAEAVRAFNRKSAEAFGHLPSAPAQSIVLTGGQYEPQPRKHRNIHGGMAVCIGQVEAESRRMQFVALSHNTKKGAAKGGIFVAECLVDRGYIRK